LRRPGGSLCHSPRDPPPPVADRSGRDRPADRPRPRSRGVRPHDPGSAAPAGVGRRGRRPERVRTSRCGLGRPVL